MIRRIALGLIFTLVLIAKATAAPAQIGQMVWVKGVVKAAGAQGTRALQRRSPIYAQDTVTTSSGASGQIVFSDNSLVSLGSDAAMKINEYAFGKNVPAGQSKYVASMVKGSMRTITGLIPKGNPENYQVKTPVATIGVTGTQFAVVVNRNGQLFVKYYQGSPCIRSGSKRVCLGPDAPYGSVLSSDAIPVTSMDPPTDFSSVPGLTPGKYSPGGTGGGGSKVVGGFCIG